MTKNQIAINQSWYEDFQCIGGPCSVSCCQPEKWRVDISDLEMERYRNLGGPLKEELFNAIDTGKKQFKSKRQVFGDTAENPNSCALQTKDGWCKLVLNYGDDVLTNTCATYPRSRISLNDRILSFVDISCPEVAKNLFNDKPMTYRESKVPYQTKTATLDEEIFTGIMETRAFLMALFSNIDGYEAGKCYVLFDIINSLQSVLMDKNNVGSLIYGPIDKYAVKDTLATVLSESERFTENPEHRATMMAFAVNMFFDILVQIPARGDAFLPDMEKHLSWWKTGKELQQDMEEFYEYSRVNFPTLLDKYMTFRVFISMFTNSVLDISRDIKTGYITLLFEKITAMSLWKSRGKILSVDEYSNVISTIERAIFHSSRHKAILGEGLDKYEKEMKFSLFLLPVY